MPNRRAQLHNEYITEGTCQWLFETEEFKAWESLSVPEEGRKPVLVIKGKPGSGKSLLLYVALRKYEALSKSRPQSWVTLGFFNNSDGRPLEHTKLGMYRSLLSQLLSFLSDDSDVRRIIGDLFGSDNNEWPVDIVKSALQQFLRVDCIRNRPIFMFLDALDECQDKEQCSTPDVEDVFEFLNQLSEKSSNVRICLSIRNGVRFERFLKTTSVIDVSDHNQPSIRSYLEAQLETTISPPKFRPDFRPELLSILTRQSSSMFLWAKLVVSRIKGTPSSEQKILAVVKDTPTELGDLYINLLKHAKLKSNQETLVLLQLVHVAVKPITLADVQSALLYSRVSGDPLSDDLQNLTLESFGDYIFDLTAGLVEVSPNVAASGSYAAAASNGRPVVRFIHSSVRKFLDEGGLKILDPSLSSEPEAQSHLCIAKICVRILGTPEATDLAASADGTPTEDVSFLQYASQFWTLHVRKANEAIRQVPDEFSNVAKCSNRSATILRLFGKYRDTRFYMNKNDIPCPPRLTCLLCKYNAISTAPACQENMLVLLAFEGCTKLVVYHAEKCYRAQRCHQNGHILRRAFFSAIHRGWQKTAREVGELAAKGDVSIDVNMRLGNGFTPLLTACFKGEINAAKILLQMGAGPLSKAKAAPELPLHAAVAQGYGDVVRLLLEESVPVGQLLAQKDSSHCTILHKLARSGHYLILETLLRYMESHQLGNLVHERNKQGKTACEIAEAQSASRFLTGSRRRAFRIITERLGDFASEIE